MLIRYHKIIFVAPLVGWHLSMLKSSGFVASHFMVSHLIFGHSTPQSPAGGITLDWRSPTCVGNGLRGLPKQLEGSMMEHEALGF